MIKKQTMTTMARTRFGMLADAASVNAVDGATAVATHGVAAGVRIPGTPAWSPPDC